MLDRDPHPHLFHLPPSMRTNRINNYMYDLDKREAEYNRMHLGQYVTFWLTPEEYNHSDFCCGAKGIGCPDTPPTYALPGGTKIARNRPLLKKDLLEDMEEFKYRKMNGQRIYAMVGFIQCYDYESEGRIKYSQMDDEGVYRKLTEEEVNKLIRPTYIKYWRHFPREERPVEFQSYNIFSRMLDWLKG